MVFMGPETFLLEKEFLRKEIDATKVELDEVQQVKVPLYSKIAIEPALIRSNPKLIEEPLSRFGRVPHQSDRYFGFLVRDDDLVEFDENNEDPITYMDALQRFDYEKWLEAMKSKMEFMEINSVWTLIDPLEGVKPIECKWSPIGLE